MIREPVVAGRFYAGSKTELLEEIHQCAASPIGVGNTPVQVGGTLVGMILPHAGYVFSGPVASWGMKRLSLEKPRPSRFLLLGPKHTAYGSGAAVSKAKAWRTPLGSVPIDEELREALAGTGLIERDDQAHQHEHSLEVQLPFLQDCLPGETFSFTPVAFQYVSFDRCRKLGKAIGKILSEPRFRDVKVIVSSDFSHETPREEAYRLDDQALKLIEKLDAEGFYRLVTDEERSICGFVPITIFLSSLEGRSVQATRLKYSTSMDVMEHPRGVGYAAVVFEEHGGGH